MFDIGAPAMWSLSGELAGNRGPRTACFDSGTTWWLAVLTARLVRTLPQARLFTIESADEWDTPSSPQLQGYFLPIAAPRQSELIWQPFRVPATTGRCTRLSRLGDHTNTAAYNTTVAEAALASAKSHHSAPSAGTWAELPYTDRPLVNSGYPCFSALSP